MLHRFTSESHVAKSNPLATNVVSTGARVMTQATLSVFEHTIEITNTWLNDLTERLGWHDKHRAYQALRAVLHALRDRLTVNDASHLAAQLPMLIRGLYYEGYHPSGKPLPERKKSEFLAHVAAECPDESRNDGLITQAVLQVLAKHITHGEVEKIKAVLPPDIRSLWI
jgi:uncharacterized protein (DUF2267 family)